MYECLRFIIRTEGRRANSSRTARPNTIDEESCGDALEESYDSKVVYGYEV